jgi:hypothetical protein
MPKRVAFYFFPQLFLCTSAFGQLLNGTATAVEPTFWDHNGSVMYLVTNGLSREFYYQKPRPGMLEAGARPDSLLFRGQIDDGQFSGTAYVFNAQCGQVPFDVKGPILDSGARVVLTGQAPRVGRNCQASGYYTSTLEFGERYTCSAIPDASSSHSRTRSRGPDEFSFCNHCAERGASLPINRDLNLAAKIGTVNTGWIVTQMWRSFRARSSARYKTQSITGS